MHYCVYYNTLANIRYDIVNFHSLVLGQCLLHIYCIVVNTCCIVQLNLNLMPSYCMLMPTYCMLMYVYWILLPTSCLLILTYCIVMHTICTSRKRLIVNSVRPYLRADIAYTCKLSRVFASVSFLAGNLRLFCLLVTKIGSQRQAVMWLETSQPLWVIVRVKKLKQYGHCTNTILITDAVYFRTNKIWEQ